MIKVEFTKDNTRIINCYLLNKKTLDKTIKDIMETRKCKRTFNSYKAELKAHIRLYKLGLFRSRTRDCDLEENISKLLDVVYRIIGF